MSFSLRAIYPGGSAAGSNKIVVNPASGGASQRRSRARPIERTRPAASSSTSARCTVRWLAPTQRNPLQRSERVPGGERSRSSGDQGVHTDRLPAAPISR